MYSHSQSTPVLIDALNTLTKTDFMKRMGSGISISLVDLEGVLLTDTFTIPAEDMETIKVGIIQSIKESLKIRKVMLLSEMTSIEKVLEK